MKKKVLALLLVVLALTFVAQVFTTTHSQEAVAAMKGYNCHTVCNWLIVDMYFDPVLNHWVVIWREFCNTHCDDYTPRW